MVNDREISAPRRTTDILKKHQFFFKKSLGQNFLIDRNILNKITETARLTKNTNVIEIGPGIGSLTEQLAQRAKEVVALEIDQRLISILSETLLPYDNVTVVQKDILKTSLSDLIQKRFRMPDAPLKIVANLPYYITTPIILKLIYDQVPAQSMTFMVQKEVAERMSSSPGTKAYGSLSIAVQYYMETTFAFPVPKTVFIPPPSVDSAIIHLQRRPTPIVRVASETFFFDLVRIVFAQRRKTLWNNLVAAFPELKQNKSTWEIALAKIAIPLSCRAEALSIVELAKLSDCLYYHLVTK